MAQIAASNGLSKQDLVKRLVTVAEAQLAEAVTDGKITQARADKLKANLSARFTEQVDRVGPKPPGEGGHGPGHRGPDRSDTSDQDGTTDS